MFYNSGKRMEVNKKQIKGLKLTIKAILKKPEDTSEHSDLHPSSLLSREVLNL